jgi:CRP-like cAMP-binding protein
MFSRKDMGAMLGITTESASRVVAELKRAGVLSERTGSFHCDRAALERIAAE